jgi:crotonobetainyl-CoA:carnitine CoA-transferase CaiB-like acyl-CoA transferase
MRHQYLCPYGPFKAADGEYVNVVVASDGDWQRFCDAMSRPQWIDDPRFATMAARSSHRAELDDLVERTIGDQPAAFWAARLDAAGLPHGRVRGLPDVLTHPQLQHRELFVEGDSPVGPLPLVRFPLAGTDPLRVPAFGEHTDEVLAELGYGDEEIVRLRAERAV